MSEHAPVVKLTEAQERVVGHGEGPLLVIAGPGAGKTRVITMRVAALVAQGVDPAEIMVVTFTRAAAQEMKARVAQLPGMSTGILQGLRMGTFHSLFWNILTRYGERYSVAENWMRRKWVERALAVLGQPVNDEVVDSILSDIGFAKNNLDTLHNIAKRDRNLADVWGLYEEYKNQHGSVDYDDLLVRTYELLCRNTKALLEEQGRAKYVLLDEFQDTSKVQYEIIRILAAPQDNLCVVGDVDQAIYSWRAARPEFLLNFTRDYPLAQTVELKHNFRATPLLVAFSNNVIQHNKMRHDVRIVPVRSGGSQPNLFRPACVLSEAAQVMQMAKELGQAGTDLQDMAVFYRVNRYARHLVNAAMEQGIPFVLWEKERSFDQHWITGEILAFLRLSQNREHFSSFETLARRNLRLEVETIRQIGDAVQSGKRLWDEIARHVVRSRASEFLGHLDHVRALPPSSILDYYMGEMGFKSYLSWYAEARGADLQEWKTQCDDLRQEMKKYNGVGDYLAFVEQRSRELKRAKTESGKAGHINLMTLHAAKGLEFDQVWLVGATDGLLPHQRCQTGASREEERRLFYVGCTRAKDHLCIMSPLVLDGKGVAPSPFIAEGVGIQPARELKDKKVKLSKNSPAPLVVAIPLIGATLRHRRFGAGTVLAVRNEPSQHLIEVQFEGGKKRTLAWELSIEHELIDV